MRNKRIAVLLKFFQGELNPFDGAALECALETDAKEIIAVSMASLVVKPLMETISRLGVKCVLISDDRYAGSDTQATSFILANALEKISPDVIFCGRQSVDGDTAQVPPMIAQRLGFDIKPKVMRCENGKVVLRSRKKVDICSKTIYTFEKIKTLRFPSIFSSVGSVSVWDNQYLNLPEKFIGVAGSPTKVIKSYESCVGRRFCKFIHEDELDKVISIGLQRPRLKNKNIEKREKLSKIYYVGNIRSIAKRIANTAIPINIINRTPREIAAEIIHSNIHTVLWEDKEYLKILAPQVAVLTGAGICADCIEFNVRNGQLIMTRPARGGNITADIVCESEITFATVRTVKKTKRDIIFTIGAGGAKYIREISELKNKYGAEICASRRVVDAGLMPYSAQVGLTGKTVSPKVYVCFGVSGAVQHTCAITGAGTVIAINNDKNAKIFDYADYGIITEIKNVKL